MSYFFVLLEEKECDWKETVSPYSSLNVGTGMGNKKIYQKINELKKTIVRNGKAK